MGSDKRPKKGGSRKRHPALPFLHFPREIREQIYSYVLSDSPCEATQLLRTCKQIAAEARVFLFKRPLTFWSQAHLSDWIDGICPAHLRHVRCLRVKIDNPVSHENLEGLCLRDAGSDRLGPLAQLFKDESARITHVFDQIPNVQDLTLLRGRRDSPYCPWQNMYLSFSSVLGQRYPNLRRLAFHVHKVSLRSLAGLKSLSFLRFTGFSTSTPDETLAILQGLPRLEDLEIVGIPHRIDAEPYGPAIEQSLTPDVLRGLKPLRSFKLCDVYTTYQDGRDIRATDDMLEALDDTHVKSLRSLGLSTCLALRSPAVEQLKTFLARSHLQTVRLCSYPLEPSIIYALPPSTRHLQVCVDPSVSSSAALEVLAALRSKAQSEQLAHVDWAVREPFQMPSRSAMSRDDARIKLLTHASPMGLRVTSRKWHPLVFDNEEAEDKADLALEWPRKR